MKKITAAIVAVAAIIIAVPDAGQAQSLTDQQIQAAIERGQNTKVKDIGLFMKASALEQFKPKGLARSFLRAAINPLGNNQDFWEQFEARMYTPEAWIALQAAKAKDLRVAFTAAQVTEEMRRPIVRIVVNPYASYIIIFRKDKDSNGIQATAASTTAVPMGMPPAPSFEIPLEQVRELVRDEFIVTVQVSGVTMTGKEASAAKDFQIKKDKLDQLPIS